MEFVEICDIVGIEDLALDDGEIDLDLVEPACMNGQMDEVGVGPVFSEAAHRGGSPMATAVVDDPEHAFGGGVGLDRHDLIDEAAEWLDACSGLAAAEDLGLAAIPGRQVRKGTSALVFMFNPCGSSGAGR